MNKDFPGKRDDEHVIAWVHKHWIVFARIAVGFLIVGVGGTMLLTWLAAGIGQGMYLVAILYLLMVWFWMFMRFIDEEFDVLILTNIRVVDITQNGLFQISFSETSLDLIQDVNDKKTGILGNILSYGYLKAQTAAASIVFEFEDVPTPSQVARLIQESKRTYLVKHGRGGEADSERTIDSGA